MKKLNKKELLQKQWDNWGNEQFIYMREWAKRVAWEIYNENEKEYFIVKENGTLVLSGCGQDKTISILMESMWRN